MAKYFKSRVLVPLLLLIFFFLDGVMAMIMPGFVGDGAFRMDSTCLLMAFVLFALNLEDLLPLYVAGFVIGFLYDLYYTEILGINLFLFPLVVYVTQQVKPHLPVNLYASWLWTVFIQAVYAQLAYFVFRMLGVNFSSYGAFLVTIFTPSLLLNGFLAFLFIWLLGHISRWIEAD
ncbi:MAG: rod shape-determining protein MreD [Aerococcus sp.]|nr:rod shape-determining protein MreD [Aerococcus sp.]